MKKPIPYLCPVCRELLVLRYQTVHNIRRGRRIKIRRKRRVCLGCNVVVVLHVYDRKKV